MERNMELVRALLLELEAVPDPDGPGRMPDIEGYTKDEIAYHLYLLADARLIEVIDLSSKASWEYIPRRITWVGHEFIDAAKNDTWWNRAMATVREKGGAVPFVVLQQLLITIATNQVGLP